MLSLSIPLHVSRISARVFTKTFHICVNAQVRVRVAISFDIRRALVKNRNYPGPLFMHLYQSPPAHPHPEKNTKAHSYQSPLEIPKPSHLYPSPRQNVPKPSSHIPKPSFYTKALENFTKNFFHILI